MTMRPIAIHDVLHEAAAGLRLAKHDGMPGDLNVDTALAIVEALGAVEKAMALLQRDIIELQPAYQADEEDSRPIEREGNAEVQPL
jgi:hypothetical protein